MLIFFCLDGITDCFCRLILQVFAETNNIVDEYNCKYNNVIDVLFGKPKLSKFTVASFFLKVLINCDTF